MNSITRRAAAGLAAALALPGLVRAQARPVTLIHGFGPGGPADIFSRLLAPGIGESLGQAVVVEPRPGAGGNIGAAAISRAAPDGQTIGLVTGGHAVSAAFARNLNYDPVEGFAFVSLIVRYAFVLAVRADHPAQDLRALLAMAGRAPNALQFGSAGAGSTQHLVGEMVNSMGRVQMTHVPYRGDAAAVAALLGGEVPFAVISPVVAVPHMREGKLRLLAVTSPARSSRLPEVPTAAEAGLPGFAGTTWAGVLAPRGTPPELVARLNRAVLHALDQPGVKPRLAEMVDGEAGGSTPEEMRDLVVSEIARWKALIEAQRISPE